MFHICTALLIQLVRNIGTHLEAGRLLGFGLVLLGIIILLGNRGSPGHKLQKLTESTNRPGRILGLARASLWELRSGCCQQLAVGHRLLKQGNSSDC
eukprot:1325057-Amphidinium_carterae.1